MITRAMGVPTLPFYTNFQPVFDGMKAFTNTYSKLLQSSAALMSPSIKLSAHINPRSLESMVKNSSVGKHIDIVG